MKNCVALDPFRPSETLRHKKNDLNNFFLVGKSF